MSNVFFISDLHFNHANLLGFRSEVHKKLFPSTEYMDDWLIAGWNSRVRPKDLVWVLGDIAWGSVGLSKFAQLNGTKNLIMGNHDKFTIKELLRDFNEIRGVWKKYGFVMSHCPIHPNELQYRNWTCNVHGHIHHREKLLPEPMYINVNVDIIGNVPISLDEIRAKLK